MDPLALIIKGFERKCSSEGVWPFFVAKDRELDSFVYNERTLKDSGNIWKEWEFRKRKGVPNSTKVKLSLNNLTVDGKLAFSDSCVFEIRMGFGEDYGNGVPEKFNRYFDDAIERFYDRFACDMRGKKLEK